MATTTLNERAPDRPVPGVSSRLDRALGHPVAFLVTTAVLLGLFGGTFIANPHRVAPTKDPAYYTWRTEALVSEEPVTLLEVEGAFDMFAGGYRVAAPVIGGFLRHAADVSSLNVTVLVMVLVPVLAALALAGFAYRSRPDPLIFHVVALGTGSLFLTPPFVGYLDNMLALLFLAAALWFIAPARTTWAGRAGLFLFLLIAGFTHPTSLAIFFLTLGAIAGVRLLFRRFDIRSIVREDGPMLLTGLGAVVTTYVIWKAGIWGKSASLSESALPPPYGSDFFLNRMMLWIEAMNPVLNAPLFLLGIVGLLAYTRRRWTENDLAVVSIVWLAPLAGLFGFVAGIAYPYYRFFNTTLAWVLLVGLGAYFGMRFFIDRARAGGPRRLALLGVVAIAVVFGANFAAGFETSGWNRPESGWLSATERADLDALRDRLRATEGERPVVFVIDDEPPRPFQIWGFTKLSGNTSRYGLPRGQVDDAYLYLGSYENYLAGEPTLRGEETYDKLSPALLEDAEDGMEAGQEPIVVLASIFNEKGANVALASGAQEPQQYPENGEVWVLADRAVTPYSASNSGVDSFAAVDLREPRDGLGHLLRVVVGLALLLVPGLLALRWFIPGARVSAAVGMGPALSLVLLTLTGIAVLALTRATFSTPIAWVSWGIATVVAGVLFLRSRARHGQVAAEAA